MSKLTIVYYIYLKCCAQLQPFFITAWKYDLTIEDYYWKEADINDNPAVLEIIDTTGTEQFTAMRDRYIENGEEFMLVYSIINRQTFIDLQPLRGEIARVKGGFSSPIMLVGNKCDMEEERSVKTQEGEKLAEEWGCQFYETSAKARCKVEELAQLINQLKKRVDVVPAYEKLFNDLFGGYMHGRSTQLYCFCKYYAKTDSICLFNYLLVCLQKNVTLNSSIS